MRLAALLTVLVLAGLPLTAEAQRSPVILSTTTSTQDSGLLDALIPCSSARPATA
jgi:ABC-type tungstate transport system permease subunit